MFDLEHAIAKEDYGRVFKSAFASTPCKCLTDMYLSHLFHAVEDQAQGQATAQGNQV